VNRSTTYDGLATRLADLQVGWFADVGCVPMSSTTYLAHHVHTATTGGDT
jgi:hypothetical protein